MAGMTTAVKRLLCLGDSNTFGFNPAAPMEGPYQGRWTDLLTGWQVLNRGQNGLTIPQESEVYADLIQSLLPLDAVTVMLGTNDLLAGETAEQVTGKMRTFLTAIQERCPNINFILLSPPVMTWGDWVQKESILTESARLGQCYRALAEELGVGFADAGEWGIPLTFDGVHLTQEGHRIFAEGVQRTIDQ